MHAQIDVNTSQDQAGQKRIGHGFDDEVHLNS
ncbi:MAG: hypothetical protein ACI8QS_003431 [Planctomycetota bacterium]